MSSSLDGLLHCTQLFFPIMMKIVSVTVASVFRVGILTLFLLVVSCVLCYARLLYAFMVPPSLFLTGIASMTSKCVFPVCFVLLIFTHTQRHFVFLSFLFDSCNLCHSNKLESLFECPISRLLYDEGKVEYWLYEPINLTEQSATHARCAVHSSGRDFS